MIFVKDGQILEIRPVTDKCGRIRDYLTFARSLWTSPLSLTLCLYQCWSAVLDEVIWSGLIFTHLLLMIEALGFEGIKETGKTFRVYLRRLLPSCLSLGSTSSRLRRTLSLSWRPLVRFVSCARSTMAFVDLSSNMCSLGPRSPRWSHPEGQGHQERLWDWGDWWQLQGDRHNRHKCPGQHFHHRTGGWVGDHHRREDQGESSSRIKKHCAGLFWMNHHLIQTEPELSSVLIHCSVNVTWLKAVVHREGNKLKVSLKGIESVTELVDGNTIVNVSKKQNTTAFWCYSIHLDQI